MTDIRDQIARARHLHYCGELRHARGLYHRLAGRVDLPERPGVEAFPDPFAELLDLRYLLHPPVDARDFKRELRLLNRQRKELSGRLNQAGCFLLHVIRAELALKAGKTEYAGACLKSCGKPGEATAPEWLRCRRQLVRADIRARRAEFLQARDLLSECMTRLKLLPYDRELPLATRAAFLMRTCQIWPDDRERVKLLQLRLHRRSWHGLNPVLHLLKAGREAAVHNTQRAERLLDRFRSSANPATTPVEHFYLERILRATIAVQNNSAEQTSAVLRKCREWEHRHSIRPGLELLRQQVRALYLLDAGRLGEAREELDALERRGASRPVSPLRDLYFYARALVQFTNSTIHQAEQSLRRARTWLRQVSAPLLPCKIRLLEAKVFLAQESYLRARYKAESAIDLAGRAGLDQVETEAHILLSEIALTRNNVDELRKRVERAKQRFSGTSPRLEKQIQRLESEIETISELRVV